MSTQEKLNELSNREFRHKRIIAATTLAFSALILAIVAMIYLANLQSNFDKNDSFLFAGGVVIVMVQFIGFGYLGYVRHNIHQERMALIGQDNNKRKKG